MLNGVDVDYDIEAYPWARSYKYALNQKNVVIFSIARAPHRENKFYWIGKVHREDYYFYKLKKNSRLKVDSFDDVREYAIAVIQDSAVEEYLSKKGFLNLEKTSTVSSSFKMLYQRRVDLIFGAGLAFGHQLMEHGYNLNQLQRVLHVPDISSDLYIAASLGTEPKLLELLKEEFARLLDTGAITRLQKKWQVGKYSTLDH